MEKLLKKLKSEKGATGTDVLISSTIIVLAIMVVSMLYVNTSLESRNITRTAGATRIATNIIENIELLSYDEFLTTFTGYAGAAATSTTQTETTVFNTKIPTGYTVTMTAVPVYGSVTDTTQQFDLVRQVEVKVQYNVGNTVEQVDFRTVKQREMIDECNFPDTGSLRSSKILQAGMNYYPVKYVQSANAYVKTTESDPEWYNYTNKNWAMIIVSKTEEASLFDANGKFIGTINTDATNSAYTQKFLWIPRFYAHNNATATSPNLNVQFAFNASTSQIISKSELTAKDNASKFTYYTFANIDTSAWNADSSTSMFSTKTGNWVTLEQMSTEASALTLNKSQYGPCNLH